MLDRRSLVKHAGIAGVLAAGAAPAVHAAPLVRWRLASSFPKSLDTIYGGAETFARHVKAISGGRFDVSVHPAGELMPAFSVGRWCAAGAALKRRTRRLIIFIEKDDTFAIGGAIPVRPEQPANECVDLPGQRAHG